MLTLVIRHQVADFAKWKAGYDAHAEARKSAMLEEKQVLRSIDNPNEVIIFYTAKDLKKAKSFVGSPGLHEAMRKSGVRDLPDIYFLK